MAQSATCQTAAATVGHQGAREEDAQSSMVALLKRRTDSGGIPGNISNIPFQKVKSRISSQFNVSIFPICVTF